MAGSERSLSPSDLDVDLTDVDPELQQEMQDYVSRRRLELLFAEKQRLLPDIELTVTIKFALNTGERFTGAFGYLSSFASIKEELASVFQVPVGVLAIYQKDQEVADHQKPAEFGVEPFDTLDLRLESREACNWPLRCSQLQLPTPDILTVTVDGEREVVVEVEDRTIRKPFLGGYRDTATGVEYHNAAAQCTVIRKRGEQFSRDTQTAATLQKSTATPSEKATQSGEGEFFFQRLLTPHPYKPFEPKIDYDGAAKCIQRNYRAHLLRSKLAEIIRIKREEKEKEEEKVQARQSLDVQRMTYPKTKADFDMLYAMVERWRKAQTERIAQLKTDGPRKAELCTILEKEVKLLESIEAHRIRMLNDQRQERERRFLQHIGQPVAWTGYRGLRISMDTVRTQRARELSAMYDQLAEDVTASVRVERLMALKHAIKTQETPVTQELTELVDREAELLARAVPDKQLRFLRSRIQQLFFRYFKETDSKQPVQERHIFCRLCRRMRARQNFSIAARDSDVAVCGTCRMARGDAHEYRHILRSVRRDEQRRGCFSSCAFVMTEEDIEFLVTSIWHARSIVSSVEELRALRMPRWNMGQDWTPWNCVLLTEREARAHEKIPAQDLYGEHLLSDVTAKHELAKRHFGQLHAVDERLRDSGVWVNVKDSFIDEKN